MHRHKKRTLILLITLYGGLVLFLIATNPANLPILVLVLPLLWLFVALSYSFWLLLGIFRISEGQDNTYRRLAYAAVGAALPVGLLLLNSVDQLTMKDILLILLLALTCGVYVGRFRLRQKSS